jgi:hypothetical protein
LDGETLSGCGVRVKLGFGKSMPTNCVWLHGISESLSEKTLGRQCARFGPVVDLAVDRERCNCLVFYDSIDCAQIAVTDLKGRLLNGRRLQVDFASRECQNSFLEKLDAVQTDGNKSNAWENSSTTSVRSRLGPIGTAANWNATNDDIELRLSYGDHRDRQPANTCPATNTTGIANATSGAGTGSVRGGSIAMLGPANNVAANSRRPLCAGSPSPVTSSLVPPTNSANWSATNSCERIRNRCEFVNQRSNSVSANNSRSRYEDDFGAEPIESDGYEEFGPPTQPHHHSANHHGSHMNSSSSVTREHHHRRLEYRESESRARSFSPCDKDITLRHDDKVYASKADEYAAKERYAFYSNFFLISSLNFCLIRIFCLFCKPD